MIHTDNDVEAVVKEFILTEFLPGEDPVALTDTTALLTTGILDSIATLQLVDFLESRFQISIPPHEIDVDHLDSVAAVAQLVRTGGEAPRHDERRGTSHPRRGLGPEPRGWGRGRDDRGLVHDRPVRSTCPSTWYLTCSSYRRTCPCRRPIRPTTNN